MYKITFIIECIKIKKADDGVLVYPLLLQNSSKRSGSMASTQNEMQHVKMLFTSLTGCGKKQNFADGYRVKPKIFSGFQENLVPESRL